MASSSLNTGFAKCFILFMAIVILLQGAVYIGLAIWGITLRSCNEETTDIASRPFQFAMDLIYFLKEECGAPTVTFGTTLVEGVPDQQIELDVDWAASEIVTNRTYILMIVYAAISGLWIVTSLLIIFTLCASTTKIISAVCYWPWFIVVIAGCCLDVTATVFFSIDISNTGSLDDAFSYVGVSVPESPIAETIITFLRTFDPYFITPSVIMTCISARVGLIFLLNIFGVAFCLSLSRSLAQKHTESNTTIKPKKPTAVDSNGGQRQAASNSREMSEIETVNQPSAQSLQQQQQQPAQYNEPYPQQIKPKPLPIMIPPPAVQRQDSHNYQENERNSLQSPITQTQTPIVYAASSDKNRNEQPVPLATIDTTYRNTETHPDRLDYPVQNSSTPELRAKSSPPPQLAVASPLNNRYSESYIFPNQPQRVSEELRSQLPWSYTSMPVKPQPPPPPRKPQQQVQIYPTIPEPDYTEQEPVRNVPEQQPQQQQQQQNYSRW